MIANSLTENLEFPLVAGFFSLFTENLEFAQPFLQSFAGRSRRYSIFRKAPVVP